MIKNTLKNQKYYKNVENTIVENRYALLCEKFKLYGNKKKKYFWRKGKIFNPCNYY